MKKIAFLLTFCISVLLLVSCNGKNSSSAGVGSLTFSLELRGVPGYKSKISMAPIDCTVTGIAAIEAAVYDQAGVFLVNGGPWACNLHSGTIAGISAGSNRKIVINTRDASGNIVYSGEKTGLSITVGTNTDAGTIILKPFISWSVNTLETTGDVGSFSSIAQSPTGTVHIAYYDVTNRDLKYITNTTGAWVTATIDSAGDVGQYPSIALDSAGKIHICYYDTTNMDLKYTSNSFGSWVTETVDSSGDVGKYSAVAVDVGNKAHVSYYDATNGDLKYATNSSGSWIVSPALDGSTTDVGQYTSIAIDASGKAHISYLDVTNMDLKYATNAGVSWSYTALDQTGNVGEYSDIALDTGGKVHISYFDANNQALKYASNATGTWVSDNVDTQTVSYYYSTGTVSYVGYRTSIAVDSDGKAHISYHERVHNLSSGYAYNYRYKLKYATNSSGSWIPYAVDSISADYAAATNESETAIAVDSNKKVHISYYQIGSGDLKYATSSPSSWAVNTIDMAGDVGQYTSMAVDSTGKAYIGFYDSTNGNLKYETNASGAWAASTVDSVGNTGQYVSIGLDSSKKAHISFYDATSKCLRYATNALTSWTTTTIDSSAVDVGQFSSLALDSSGKAHVSYIDETNKNLKYATNKSGTWAAPDIVDSAGNVGYHTDIALDSAGKAYISYSDESGQLKYATNISGSWLFATVDTSTTTSGVQYQYTSIRIDSSGKAHISYYDVVNGDLKYATNASGGWVATTIDSAEDVGKFSSLALDGAGKIHISYYDATNGDLRYATNYSGSWLVYTLDSGGDVGQYASIAVDGSNKLHISYYDTTSSDLKYATNTVGGGGNLGDQTGPVAPTGLTALPNSVNQISIAWTASSDNIGVAGYKIYRDGVYLDLISSATATTFPDTGLSPGTQHCYTVSAYDASNNESMSSSQACATTFLFNSETIVNGVYNYYTDLAMDNTDIPHVSYYDYAEGGVLKYATRTLGSWSTSTVYNPDAAQSSAGQPNAIAVGPSSLSLITQVSRWETTPSNHWEYDLVHTAGSVGSWVTTTLETISTYNYYNLAIAVDTSGYSHLVYTFYDSGSSLYVTKYATDSLGSWTTNTVLAASMQVAIAADSANNVHIAYATGSDLVYAVKPAGSSTWATTTVDTATVANFWFSDPSIAVDSNNNVHIAYHDGQWIDGSYHTKYATNESGSWVKTTIDSGSGKPSIAIDAANNTVHMTYNSYATSKLKYATFPIGSADAPAIYTIENGSAAYGIKIDSNHKVHILSSDNSTGGLKYLSSP